MWYHVLQFLYRRSSLTILWPDYNPANLQTSLETTPSPCVALSWQIASIQASSLPTWRRRCLYLHKTNTRKNAQQMIIEKYYHDTHFCHPNTWLHQSDWRRIANNRNHRRKVDEPGWWPACVWRRSRFFRTTHIFHYQSQKPTSKK